MLSQGFPQKKNKRGDFWKVRCRCCEPVMPKAHMPVTPSHREVQGISPISFFKVKSANGTFWQNLEVFLAFCQSGSGIKQCGATDPHFGESHVSGVGVNVGSFSIGSISDAHVYWTGYLPTYFTHISASAIVLCSKIWYVHQPWKCELSRHVAAYKRFICIQNAILGNDLP